MSRVKLTINSNKSVDDLSSMVERNDSSNGQAALQDLRRMFQSMIASPGNKTLTVELDRFAVGSVTCNGVAPADTVTINGKLKTAVASSPGANQFACGTLASLVVQDITYTAVPRGAQGNNISIEYVGGGTAGSEVVTVTDSAIVIEIEDGVSTATQVKAAFDAESDATDLASATITGTAGDAQDVEAEANLAGGVGNNITTAQSLLAALQADSDVTDDLSLDISANQINLEAKEPGPAGNAITTVSSNGSRLPVSGATLSGGQDPDIVVYAI
jgi:hypothetical protein